MSIIRMKWLILFLCFCSAVNARERNTANRLTTDLLANYSRHVRPVANQSDVLHVLLQCSLFNIIEVNEAKEQVTFTQWQTLQWTDSSLIWNPEDYDGIKRLSIFKTELWIPDMTTLELTNVMYPIDQSAQIVQVASNGLITFDWPEVVTIHCGFDVTDFPYDEQTCKQTFSSWVYNSEELITTANPGSAAQDFQPNPEWDMINFNASTQVTIYSDKPFYEVIVKYTLRRKPFFYVITLALPSFAITALCLLGLFSPTTADQTRTEKVTIGLTGLLTISVLLLMVSELMPKSSRLPRLGMFIIVEMFFLFLCTVTQVGVMYIHSLSAFGRTVPRWLKCLLALQGQSDKVDVIEYSSKERLITKVEPIDVTKSVEAQLNTLHQLYEFKRCIRSVMTSLAFFEQCQAEEEAKQQNQETWAKLCFRIDTFLLFLSQGLNVAILCYYVL